MFVFLCGLFKDYKKRKTISGDLCRLPSAVNVMLKLSNDAELNNPQYKNGSYGLETASTLRDRLKCLEKTMYEGCSTI